MDVNPNGNCGFRVIVNAIGYEGGDEGWRMVRREIFKEMVSNEALYRTVFQDTKHERIRDAINVYESPAPGTSWLTLPYMGLFVATCFHIGFVVLVKRGSNLLLPIRNLAPPLF
ncbi:hypothetical protein Scep_021865 [Stephania cephalantha]|uniref:OTU domain-containing protein n=1 Tax=Stephania cephalantha TaxID=152367 RepID=A0AAP0F486_9MAGN